MLPLLPQYTHIINPKLKHIYLRFDEKGNLIIKSPKVSQKRIEKLLLKKAAWINSAREKIATKKGKCADFSSQEITLYYLGNSYPLHLTIHNLKRSTLSFDQERFTLCYDRYDESLFHKKIDHFYKQEAQKHVPQLVEKWAQKMQLSPTKVNFRKTKRQWGSCSAKDALSFNTMMMKLPQDLIEYIIVHELAHIEHKHHQRPFWELVSKHLPHYRELIAELKTYQ
jgi:predicted metal-dependent hydrolase